MFIAETWDMDNTENNRLFRVELMSNKTTDCSALN